MNNDNGNSVNVIIPNCMFHSIDIIIEFIRTNDEETINIPLMDYLSQL